MRKQSSFDDERRNPDIGLFPLFNPFNLLFDASSSQESLFDMDSPFVRWSSSFPLLLHNGRVWEPPYARVLRQLGLFDPMEIPRHATIGKHGNSTFPIVVHSAGTLQQPSKGREERDTWLADSDKFANEVKRDILDPISETFGTTTRWAIGSLFGQMRDAMDYVESTIQRPGEENRKDGKQKQTQEKDKAVSTSFAQAIRDDLISNFDWVFPEADKGIRTSYYQVSLRTMPDGSIETRKVVRGNDGTKKTTVTIQHPTSSNDDDETFTSIESGAYSRDTGDKKEE